MYLSTFTTTTLLQTMYCEWGPVAILAGGFCFLLVLLFVEVQQTGALVLLVNVLLANATVSASQEQEKPRG